MAVFDITVDTFEWQKSDDNFLVTAFVIRRYKHTNTLIEQSLYWCIHVFITVMHSIIISLCL